MYGVAWGGDRDMGDSKERHQSTPNQRRYVAQVVPCSTLSSTKPVTVCCHHLYSTNCHYPLWYTLRYHAATTLRYYAAITNSFCNYFYYCIMLLPECVPPPL